MMKTDETNVEKQKTNMYTTMMKLKNMGEKKWSLIKAVQIQWHMMKYDEKHDEKYRKQMKTMTAWGRHDETKDEMWLKNAISKQEQNDENRWETWWPLMRTNSETVTTWYKLRVCDTNDIIRTHDKMIKTEEVRMKYGKNDSTLQKHHSIVTIQEKMMNIHSKTM